ncbi:glycosyltransferase family 2 protein [Vineibacter terrae]|uniref:glycosyltransferase family 2 protein n=1 Tax=Vineibacter terrae TaxID=2586908 RepID=UPI001C49B2ED|nr:glycosyltransferase family 2 protein [Vineibacter terrae]
MTADRIADVAVLIVGFRNPADILNCLTGLSKAAIAPGFDVFICENGGQTAYERLARDLIDRGLCVAANDEPGPFDIGTSRLTDIEQLQLTARPSRVWIGCAAENLGYAGGINAWLAPLLKLSGWRGVWILNPDTKPEAHALTALVERAEAGGKGMVGSTIVDEDRPEHVRFRGGLRWQRLAPRSVPIGLGDHLGAPHDLLSIEDAMDSPSGASMYVTRACVEAIGLMDERYFLFFEDLDWGMRAKRFGLGYASASIVSHGRGTTTGSARTAAAIPKLTVYLQHRNGVHFVRRFFPWGLPARIAVSLLYAVRFLIRRAPGNFIAVIKGVLAGLKGEVGRPGWHRQQS